MYGLALRYSSLSFAGFQFDYVFYWILRSQQAQIATPSQPLVSGIASLFSSYKLHLHLTMVALFRALVPDPAQTFLQPFPMQKDIQVIFWHASLCSLISKLEHADTISSV